MDEPKASFKGNKSYLPCKPCVVCGREMTWRKAWAKNWSDVKYCSERCRSEGPSRAVNQTSKTTRVQS
jgi:hypothetical protein